MGRYYKLDLYAPKATAPTRTWTSLPSGVFDPGALEIQFDIMSTAADVSGGGSTITLAGVALADLLQPKQFAGYQLKLEGGMTGGLPLENPKQKGPLVTGYILQSFGNWSGVDQNLSFVVWPSLHTTSTPGNFTLHWKQGTPLGDAIKTTLQNAYGPQYTVFVKISNAYARNHDVPGHYKTFSEFAQWVTKATKTATTLGVRCYEPVDGVIRVLDGQDVSQSGTAIAFNDLVGQPTWNGTNSIQISVVLRGDILPGTYITMPQGLANTPGVSQTAIGATQATLKQRTTFQGMFGVRGVRHIGNSRDPAGGAWITILDCFVPPSAGMTSVVK